MTVPRPSVPGVSSDAPEAATARRAALRDYFAANGERFTADALRQAALDAGYTPAEVDAAVDTSHSAPTAWWSTPTLATAFLTTIAIWVALFVVSQRTSGMAESMVLAIVVAICVVGSFSLRRRRPQVGRGLACGVVAALVIPLALFLALLGICVAIGFRPGGFS